MIVFPMAGLSSRFTKAGYDRPKWMLPLAGRPLLDWSLLGFSEMFGSETFLLIHLDRPGVAEFVRARAEIVGQARRTGILVVHLWHQVGHFLHVLDAFQALQQVGHRAQVVVAAGDADAELGHGKDSRRGLLQPAAGPIKSR